MVRKYDYSIDYAIAYSIYNYGSLTYRRLKGIIEGVEYLNRTSLSRDTYHFHFKKMKSGNYIFARNTDEWKRGKRLFYSLTDSIREQLELNTLVIQHVDENKREKVSSSYRRLKKYYQQLSEHAQIGLKRRRIQYIIFKVISRESPTGIANIRAFL